MVAAQHERDQVVVLALDDQRFQAAVRRHAEPGGKIFDGVHARGIDGFHCPARRRAFSGRGQGFGHLHVGRVTATLGEGNGVLARIGEHVEFL